jgi:hypothetical protein
MSILREAAKLRIKARSVIFHDHDHAVAPSLQRREWTCVGARSYSGPALQ